MRIGTILFGALAATCSCAAQTAVKVVSHTPPLGFVRWTDPNENAFSAETPRGWNVTGGLIRRSPIDAQQTMQVVSPDGIRMILGDARIPTFVTPNQILYQTGFPEGARYPNGYGGYNIVRRYVPGTAFAEEYARAAAGAGCTGFQVTDRRPRPDLSASLNRLLATFPGVTVRLDTGEVAFTCVSGDRTMAGYYFAGTLSSVVTNGPGIWVAYILHGFVAPAPRTGLASAALRRLVATHQTNPEWAARQSRLTMESSRIMAQANAETSRVISESYWTRQRSRDNVLRKDANARRGTTDLADPSTGETWNVWSSSRYYWTKPGSGVIVGTDSPNSPGVGYTQLNEY